MQTLGAYDVFPDPVLVHDGERWLYANEPATAMLRAPSRDAIVGKPILRFIPPAAAGAIGERARSVVDGVRTSTLDQQLVACDGSVLDVQISGAPLVLDDGRRAAVLSVRDLTRRLQAERLAHAAASALAR